MAVRAKCPKCDTSYTLADAQRGKTVRCRQCGEGFRVGAAPQDEAAKEAARIAKIRQEGFATPSKAKSDPRRAKDEDEAVRDDRRSRKPSYQRKSSSSPWPLILIIGGGALLLFLICGGVLVFILAIAGSTTGESGGNGILANGNASAPAFQASPKDVAEALDWITKGNDPNKKNAAADWLSKATVDAGRRAEVAAALENMAANPNTHEAAIRGLATWAGPDDAPTLLKAVDADNNLWQFDKGGDGPADALIKLNYEPAAAAFARRLPQYPQSAARRLAALGPAAEKETLKYMDSPKDDVRAAVDGLLKEYHTKPEAMFDQAVADLKNPDLDIERAACNYLAKTPVIPAQQAEVSKALEGPLNDGKSETRDAAAKALKTWGTADNVPSLIALLDSEPPFYPHFVVAMEALIPLKNEKGTEAIASYLAKPFHDQDAVRGLRAMGPIAEKAVAGYLNNKEAGVRERAASLIKGYGTKPEVLLPAVIADLRAPEAEQRKAACEWLARTPVVEAQQKEVARALDGLLDDPGPFGNVRQAAAKALAVWGDKDSVPALIRAMQKTNGDIAPQSIDALAALKDERAVLPLILETQNIFHKEAARKALIQMGPLVETALDDIVIDVKATPEARIQACQLLASPAVGIGTAKSKPALTAASKDANAAVKKTAAAALAVLKRRS